MTRTEWPISQGGNGHWYWVVRAPEGLTWDEANTAAQAQGGYLATITSAEENAFVFALMQDAAYWNGPRGPWMGGYQTPGSGLREGWHWVTGEPFVYGTWSPGQPNDAGGVDETRLEYGWGATTPTDTWNDQPDWFRDVYSYVVETEPGGPTRVMATAVPATETAPAPRELLDRYRQAVTAWDRSVSMRVECDHSMNDRGRDIRHWKYDLRQRRDGDR